MTPRLLAAACLGLALLLGAPAAGATTPGEARYGAAAVRATNNARLHHDLRTLGVDACLQRFAARQARAMARRGELFHQQLSTVMTECGLSTAGENVAYGYPSGRSVVRHGWLRSPGHRANILNRSYRRVAVAARQDDSGIFWVAQVFGRR